MTLLVIDGEPIMLSVRIGGADFDLGTFDSILDAAELAASGSVTVACASPLTVTPGWLMRRSGRRRC